jgi:hypothetical protein
MTLTLEYDLIIPKEFVVLEENPTYEWVDDEYLKDVVTEDDTPVDNWSSEKHQRLLTQTLYNYKDEMPFNWPFLLASNVGIFPDWKVPPIVPDVFLSLGVDVPKDWWRKRDRTYFVPNFGKVPEIVIEIVSNKIGNEDSKKLLDYAKLGVLYYVIFDPNKHLSEDILRLYELHRGRYRKMGQAWFPVLGLGLQLWNGEFEGRYEQWLRWCDRQGRVFPTGSELAERAEYERSQREHAQQQTKQERSQREHAQQQAKQERSQRELAQQQAELAQQQAEKLAAKLRELGVDPTTVLGSSKF